MPSKPPLGFTVVVLSYLWLCPVAQVMNPPLENLPVNFDNNIHICKLATKLHSQDYKPSQSGS